MSRLSWTGIALSLAALGLFGLQGAARAQDETKTAHELRADYDKDLKGKTIAFSADRHRRSADG